ncbi:hypothetical protein GT755_27275 [Herbidospora sp. NEAU-GS84]|uniref:Uncharacterized protein n=1 Tax=Herbidospora solisilvae TaxID=2696284 RepID=A0A7C9N5P9_9ACTN|nr:hypothetical protein [Herbidospora solisilvae]NAS25374.1 hypothetical protein [Herbidospora solisilvae]
MNHKPYTYLTVSLTGQEVGHLGISFHTADVRVSAFVVKGERPCLNISSSQASVSIGTTGAGPVTGQDLSLARTLHAAAVRYLADCERLHNAA